jgi:hypothetical protein
MVEEELIFLKKEKAVIMQDVELLRNRVKLLQMELEKGKKKVKEIKIKTKQIRTR